MPKQAGIATIHILVCHGKFSKITVQLKVLDESHY